MPWYGHDDVNMAGPVALWLGVAVAAFLAVNCAKRTRQVNQKKSTPLGTPVGDIDLAPPLTDHTHHPPQ